MLRKLLKYDLKALFRYWWAAAGVSVIMAVVGGFASSLLNADRELPTAVNIIANLVLWLSMFSFAAFFVVMLVMIFIRYYRNFFTDEGYLTFTLPVTRKDLLLSKVIAGSITLGATLGVCTVNVMIMILVSAPDEFLSPEFFREVTEFFREMFRELGMYSVVYIMELLLIGVATVVFTVVFLYLCVTFAATIVRKGKLIAAIGIYYGANSTFTFLLQLLSLFCISSLSEWLSHIPVEAGEPVAALILLSALCYIAMFTGLAYVLSYRMLDRKLNLS